MKELNVFDEQTSLFFFYSKHIINPNFEKLIEVLKENNPVFSDHKEIYLVKSEDFAYEVGLVIEKFQRDFKHFWISNEETNRVVIFDLTDVDTKTLLKNFKEYQKSLEFINQPNKFQHKVIFHLGLRDEKDLDKFHIIDNLIFIETEM